MVAETLPFQLSHRYTLLEQLGRGSMGSVYRSVDRLSGQIVALKHVLPDNKPLFTGSQPDDSVDLRVALAHEFEMLSSLHHPSIISVLDYGFDSQQTPFFTMEYLPDARTIVEAGKNCTVDTKIDLLVELLQALIYVHHRGIVHRDVKPGNVLVSNGHVRLLDFGLSVGQHQAAGTSGTLAYMAPELFLGASADIRSDLYAVGVIMYELFTGTHPFKDDTITGLIERIKFQAVAFTDLDIDPALKLILACFLDKKPSDRYQTAAEVIGALAKATGRTLPIETAATRESFLQAAKLVGRDTELTRLKETLHGVINGDGKAVLIAGESGVGKSRLLQEVRTQALVRGVVVVQGQAVSEGGQPYQVWQDTLRWLAITTAISPVEASTLKPLLPDIERLTNDHVDDAPELETKAAQTRLFTTISELIARHKEPLVIILEDLHWADSESLALLAWLSRLLALPNNVSKLPVLILGSYRNDERPNLPTILPDAGTIQLERLSGQSIAALSESVLGEVGARKEIVDLLERETEGNAFFLVEVVRSLAETAGQLDQIGVAALPNSVFAGGIQRIITERLNRLSPSDRPLLQLAAVAGRMIDVDLLRAVDMVADLDGWLIRCANAAVLDVQDQRWRFTHDKIREGLLAELTSDTECKLHQIIATTLETIKSDVANYAAALAHHWSVAGDLVKEAYYLGLAGEQSAARFATDEAIRYLTRALDLTTEAESKAQLSLKLARVLRVVGRWSEAEAFYQAIISQYESEHPLRLQAEKALGNLLFDMGRFVDSSVTLDTVLTKFEKQQDKQGLAEVKWLLATIKLQRGEYSDALTLYQETLKMAEELGDQELIGNALGFTGFVYLDQGINDLALDYLQRWHTIAQRIGDKIGMRRANTNMGLIFTAQERHLEALQLHAEALHLSIELGDKQFIGKAFWGYGDDYSGFGDWERAKACYSQQLYYALTIGDRRDVAVALGKLANIFLEQGYYEDAEIISEKSLVLCKALDIPYFTYEYLYNQAHLFARQKRYYDAVKCCTEALEMIEQLNGRKNIKLRALLLELWLRVALHKTEHADAVVALRQMLDVWTAEQERAMINYTIWRIDPTQEQHRQRAADLISTLYTTTPTYELRQRYTELTGATLSALPRLPELPDIARANPVNLDTLLVEVDSVIESVKRG